MSADSLEMLRSGLREIRNAAGKLRRQKWSAASELNRVLQAHAVRQHSPDLQHSRSNAVFGRPERRSVGISPVNWLRGLFRLWLLASLSWVGCVFWIEWTTLKADLSCIVRPSEVSPDVWCRFRDEVDLLLLTFVVPVAILLLGYAMVWVGRGFRHSDKLGAGNDGWPT